MSNFPSLVPPDALRHGRPLKIVIFGCGYIGSRFARVAAAQGHEVSALTRNAESAAALRELGIGKVVESLLHEDSWHGEFGDAQYDLVVNCVSSGGYGMDGYRLSYIEGMKSILRWLEKGHRVEHFLYTGATSVYPQDTGELVAEGDVPQLLTESGQVLLEAEQLVRDSAAQFTRATVLRLGGIYGPRRHYLLRLLRNGQTEFPGSGDFVINHIYADDAVGAICVAHARGKPGFSLYNVTDGSFPTKRELVCWLAEQLGVDPTLISFDPEDVTARAARRQVPGSVQGAMPNRRVSNALFRNELGWEPEYPSFREGYAQIMAEEGTTSA